MDILTQGGFIRTGPLVGSGLTLPAGTLAGNSTGSVGAVQGITPGAGLSLSGGVLSATVAGFDGIVTTYASLPVDGTAALNAIYLVRQASGTWFINRKQPGLYQRVATSGVLATDWHYLGEWLEEFSDANFNVYNGSDNTKALAFNLAGITTGTTRTITFPDQSGTIVLQGAATASGLTLATARLLGRTTASSGAIEEISVGSSLSLSAGALNAIQGIRTTDTPTFAGINVAPATGSATWTIDSSQAAGAGLTILNNATATPIGGGSVFSGLMLLTDYTATGQTAVLLVGNGIALIGQTGTAFTTTQGTSGKINIYLSTNTVTIENKTGGSVSVNTMFFRTRTSN